MNSAPELQPYIPSDYAFWQDAIDRENRQPIFGIGVRRICSLINGPAELTALELPCIEAGRPLQIHLEAIHADQLFTSIYRGELPWNDGIARLEFLPTLFFGVAITCTERSELPPLSGDWYPCEQTVPYRAFEGLRLFGTKSESTHEIPAEPPAASALEVVSVDAASSPELESWTTPDEVHFRSRWMHVSFALRRPRMGWLSWDGLGTARHERNFLADNIPWRGDPPVTGPFFKTPFWPVQWSAWTGKAEVAGNRVIYSELLGLDGIAMDLAFTITPDGFDLESILRNGRDRPFLEASPWRFVWEGRRTYSLSTWALSQRGPNRKGLVDARGGFHAASRGVLTFETTASSAPASVLVDSTGYAGRQAMASLCIGLEQNPDASCVLKAGEHVTQWKFRVGNVEPSLPAELKVDDAAVRGLRRGWSSVFLYRAEHAGFSNNSFSINAQNCIHFPAELAALSRSPGPVPPMIEMLRESLDLALRSGPGYGHRVAITSDTAPSQIFAASAVFRTNKDAKWLLDTWPFLVRRIDHILEHLDDDGMYFNPERSGNSGSYVSCANAWDTFVFGHNDGYGGALAYRALCELPALTEAVGDIARRDACAVAAPRLRDGYVKKLLNPTTGWFAGWRSKDGAVHDHGFVFVNAMAIAFGIPDDDLAKQIVERLEVERERAGFTLFHHGLPPQLGPVPAADFYSQGGSRRSEVPYRQDGADTFGVFTNGAITPLFAGYYLDALMRCGHHETARKICSELLPSYDAETFDGSLNGAEGFTLDGFRSGYEGTLCHSFHVLAAARRAMGWD